MRYGLPIIVGLTGWRVPLALVNYYFILISFHVFDVKPRAHKYINLCIANETVFCAQKYPRVLLHFNFSPRISSSSLFSDGGEEEAAKKIFRFLFYARRFFIRLHSSRWRMVDGEAVSHKHA